jgi:hypothetical protein
MNGGSVARVLVANLEVLPSGARETLEAAPDDSFLQLHAAGAHRSASVRTSDGRWIRIHSGHNPVVEAQRQVATAFPEDIPATVIVVGPGLGYVVDALEALAPATRVIAVEPFAPLARAMLERRDWRAAIQSGLLTLLVGSAYVGAAEAWRLVDDGESPAAVLEHPVLKREFPTEMAIARRVADRIVLGAQSNANARRRFAGRYLLNTLANLAALTGEGDAASLDGRFQGVPAIVAAAGPTLDQNIEHLQPLKNRALIIAVDTALRPLRAAGIHPHLVVAVDPSERNAQHLIGVDSAGSWLVCEGSVDPRVLAAFGNRVFGFKVSDHHPWPWLRTLGFERGTLRAWGSVVTTAFDLACEMGCDPIVFIGTDLAYTDGLHYCRGTIHEHESGRVATAESRAEMFAGWMRDNGRATCFQPDLRGISVLSTPDFVQFRDWLVSRAASINPRRVMNATGAGILYGESIAQADLTTLSLPFHPDGAHALRSTIKTAWDTALAGRRPAAERLAHALGLPDSAGVPVDVWLDFAARTIPRHELIEAVEAAGHSVQKRWNPPPVITVQPTPAVFWLPEWTVSLTASAIGPGISVRWQRREDEGPWSDIKGAEAPSYDCTFDSSNPGSAYRAVFTNEYGSTATTPFEAAFKVSGVVGDFNRDGKPDVLWHNHATGANVIWYLDGLVRTGIGELTTNVSLLWRPLAAGDFSGDGMQTVLWRHPTTGENVVWGIEGVNSIWGQLQTESDIGWTIAGAADFDGDGRAEILWRHARTGANLIWRMGLTRASVRELEPEPDTDWIIAGVGDFNRDGRPDILWRHVTSGANRLWFMNGLARVGVAALDAEPDLAWHVVGVGDFNGDGDADILWRHSKTGALVAWLMDGVTRMQRAELSTANDLTWTVTEAEQTRRHQMFDALPLAVTPDIREEETQA